MVREKAKKNQIKLWKSFNKSFKRTYKCNNVTKLDDKDVHSRCHFSSDTGVGAVRIENERTTKLWSELYSPTEIIVRQRKL